MTFCCRRIPMKFPESSPSREVYAGDHQTLCETGSLPSKCSSERYVLPNANVLENVPTIL
jgi:hypothetical protein